MLFFSSFHFADDVDVDVDAVDIYCFLISM